MKTRIFFSNLVLIAYFLLLGCKKDGTGSKNGTPGSGNSKVDASITIPEKFDTVSYAAGNKTISVMSEGAPWAAAEQPDVDWITDLTKMGNESLQVTYNENTTFQTRQVIIQITAGNKADSITFSQKTIAGTLEGEYLMDWNTTLTISYSGPGWDHQGPQTFTNSATRIPTSVIEENGSLNIRYSFIAQGQGQGAVSQLIKYEYTIGQIQESGGSMSYQVAGNVNIENGDGMFSASGATISSINGLAHTLTSNYAQTVPSTTGPLQLSYHDIVIISNITRE